MSLPFPEPWPIYRWPDGSKVSVYIDRCLIFLFESHDWTAEIGVDANREILQWIHQPMAMMDGKWVPGPLHPDEKKLVGFLLDLDVPRFKRVGTLFDSSLIHGNDRGSHYPRFVSDEVWQQRYDLVVDDLKSIKTFLPFLSTDYFYRASSTIWEEHPIWTFSVSLDRNGSYVRTFQSKTSLRGAVDQAIDRLSVLPHRDKEKWDALNTEKGQFVGCLSNEIDLYRTLGEPLPFWWALDDLVPWLKIVHESEKS